MQFIKKVYDNIFWVGANDRGLKRFENMFILPNGVTYNSYIIKDEKNVLMDGSDSSVIRTYLDNVEAALDGEDLDYIIVQHMEPDHCGSIDFILDKYPNCKFVGNQKTIKFFHQFYPNDKFEEDRFVEIKDGDELNIGKRNLKFVFAPMVHWPEVFMTYETTEGLFFSADAFGSFDVLEGHISAKHYIKKQSWVDENRRYYINIVGKQGRMVTNLLKKVSGFEINAIFPLHGPVYDDKESIRFILDKYDKWANFKPESKGVEIVFSSMYGNTELAADVLASKLDELGVENIKLYDVSDTDYSYIIADAHKYSNQVFVAMNYNAGLYHKMDALLRELVGTGYQNRHISFIHNFSWGGKSLEQAKEILENGKHEYIGEDFIINSSMKDDQEKTLEDLAKAIKEDLDK